MAATSSTALSYSKIENSLVNRLFLFKVAVKVDLNQPSSTTYSIRTLREVKDNSLFRLFFSDNSSTKTFGTPVPGSPSLSSKYKLKLIVRDSQSTANFVMLDRAARYLINQSCQELSEIDSQSALAFAYAKIMDSLIDRTFPFKVAVKVGSTSHSKPCYYIRRFNEIKSNEITTSDITPTIFNEIVRLPTCLSSVHLLKGNYFPPEETSAGSAPNFVSGFNYTSNVCVTSTDALSKHE
ncbi:hypothetical protein RIF29_20817 [Crotalaria pallida]|uniref:Uncharacterized protein n=1 Tax=Crotalaria pallida TaxID=3830 RepID=A0AAN9F473_CROPI